MTLIDRRDGASRLNLLARVLQLVLFGLIGTGVLVGNSALVVNGLLALPIVFFPSFLGWYYNHKVDPRLTIWITVAAVVHVAGFFGLYSIQSGPLSWYDQVAHALSASFVAGIGHGVIVALDRNSNHVKFPEGFRFVFTVIFILAFGVAWEIVEFSVSGLTAVLGVGDSALVQYGKDDIVFDLVFNTIAATIVAIWGTRYFDDITSIISGRIIGPRNP